jgi:hypothetical protein
MIYMTTGVQDHVARSISPGIDDGVEFCQHKHDAGLNFVIETGEGDMWLSES